MADDLPSSIVETAGQAATVRVGTVTQVSPLQVSLGGTALDMDAVGVIGGYLYAVGMPVALLGQGVQGGATSGATWLLLGPIGAAGSNTLNTISLFSVSQLIPNISIEEVEFFAENYNTGAYVWDGVADITLPFDGIFQFIFNIIFEPEITGTGVRYCEVLIGGQPRAKHRHPAIAGDFGELGVTYEGQCSGGSIVNFRVYQSSGAPLSLSYAEATIRYIGSL